jgi:glycosyltransferase involved in cell wall biosynthesis
LKILSVYNRYLNRGGEDEVFESEAALLEQHGHDVTLVEEQTRKPEGLRESARLAIDSVWSRSWYEKFEGLLKEKRPDVVHVHNVFPIISPSIYYACRRAQVPVVQSLHNPRLLCPAASFYRDGRACEDCAGKAVAWPAIVHGCYQNSRIRTSVVTTMLAVHRHLDTWRTLVDAYIVFTEFFRQKFIEFGLPASKVIVKPHFVAQDTGTKNEAGEYALFMGRLAPEKGVNTLIEAWQNLNGLPLKVRGDGPLTNAVRDLAARQSGVELLPNRLSQDDLRDLIRGSRFLVWPTPGNYETFGLVAVEAFASGVPVIASRTGAMMEIVANQRTGLHFTAGDSRDLAAKVTWAWNHPKEMRAMGRNARLEYQEKYTAERNYEMLNDIYQGVLKSAASRNGHLRTPSAGLSGNMISPSASKHSGRIPSMPQERQQPEG